MSEVLEVAARTEHGKLRNRRLRDSGKLPAVLYGHGGESVSLSVCSDQLNASLRHGAKVVDLQGAAQGQALLQEIQWDTFHQYILHVDLLRVDEKDRVKIEVDIVLRGDAAGTHEGGVVEQMVRKIEIETSPGSIPENLVAKVNELHVGDSLKASQLEGLPAGATYVKDDEMVIVHCIKPTTSDSSDEEEAAEGGSSEPEVIGQKTEEKETK